MAKLFCFYVIFLFDCLELTKEFYKFAPTHRIACCIGDWVIYL